MTSYRRDRRVVALVAERSVRGCEALEMRWVGVRSDSAARATTGYTALLKGDAHVIHRLTPGLPRRPHRGARHADRRDASGGAGAKRGPAGAAANRARRVRRRREARLQRESLRSFRGGDEGDDDRLQ